MPLPNHGSCVPEVSVRVVISGRSGEEKERNDHQRRANLSWLNFDTGKNRSLARTATPRPDWDGGSIPPFSIPVETVGGLRRTLKIPDVIQVETWIEITRLRRIASQAEVRIRCQPSSALRKSQVIIGNLVRVVWAPRNQGRKILGPICSAGILRPHKVPTWLQGHLGRAA